MKVDIGIEEGARTQIVRDLTELLAETSMLCLRTQAYRWNVAGPMSQSLQPMFGERYVELRDAMDVVAERIRALGGIAPCSYAELARHASTAEEERVPGPEQMVRRLCDEHQRLVRMARPLVAAADKTGDVVTADLLTQRIAAHEDAAGMLRRTLGWTSQWHEMEGSDN